MLYVEIILNKEEQSERGKISENEMTNWKWDETEKICKNANLEQSLAILYVWSDIQDQPI